MRKFLCMIVAVALASLMSCGWFAYCNTHFINHSTQVIEVMAYCPISNDVDYFSLKPGDSYTFHHRAAGIATPLDDVEFSYKGNGVAAIKDDDDSGFTIVFADSRGS